MSTREQIGTPPGDAEFANLTLGAGALRDPGGLPLGDVLGHSLERLTQVYAALESFALARDFDLLPDAPDVRAAGAKVQDNKQGMLDYVAAHLVPCSLLVKGGTSSAPAQRLQAVFTDGVNRSFVAHVFARTSIVHQITNYADSRCESFRAGNGTVEIFRDACESVARDRHARPREVFNDVVVPEFARVAGERIVTQQSEILAIPDPSPLLDRFGRPFEPRPGYSKVKDPDPQAWNANRRAVVQVLSIYAGTTQPDARAVGRVSEQFKALRANELREQVARRRGR